MSKETQIETSEAQTPAPVLYLGKPLPTRQEMFNRAWEGLKSQGWGPALTESFGSCAYLAHDGKRCAWGWVDPEGTARAPNGSVTYLYADYKDQPDQVGLAALLKPEDVEWAAELQRLHDQSIEATVMTFRRSHGKTMEQAMRDFAKTYGLTIPGEAPGVEETSSAQG